MEEKDDIRQKLILGYLENDLSGQDLKEFTELREKDPSVDAEITQLQEIEHSLRSLAYEEFNAEVDSWEKEAKEKPRSRNISLYYSIAAAILVLVVAVTLLRLEGGNNLQELYASNYEPYGDMILVRDNSEKGDELLVSGMTAYNQGDFTKAEKDLSDYVDSNEARPGTSLYLGIAALELGHQEMAESSFRSALNQPLFRQQAEWYLGLLYLKHDQKNKAVKQFRQIAENDGHYKFDAASKLLRELE